MLYLDYAASSPIRESALKILEKSLRENFANPSSAHKLGKDLHRRIESCRERFLEFTGAGSCYRFIFTSSATESNNTIIKGLGLKSGDTIISSSADHPSITAPVEFLRGTGVNVEELPLGPYGSVQDNALLPMLTKSVKLVLLSQVNNQSGTISDINGLSRIIKNVNPKVHVHVDAAQGFGKIPVSLREGTIDSLSVSAHKLGAPKGISGLYLHGHSDISPLLAGGGQESGMRSSTQAAPLVFSFHEAVRESIADIEASLSYVTEINRYVRESLKEKINTVSFPFWEKSSPYILTFVLPGISSDIILRHLEQEDIMISSTAACSSRSKGPNAVFKALHLPESVHKFVLRVSFAHITTKQEVQRFCDSTIAIYENLKRFMR